jgi:DNA repair exonuclease SbcCD ATPase subunit
MTFNTRINNLEKSFYLSLEGYKKAYVQKARDNTSENQNIFNSAEGRLNRVFSDLVQLTADIQNTIKTNSDTISVGNAQITSAKESWDSAKTELQNEYTNNLAADPLKHDTNLEKNSSYLTNLFYALGLMGIMTLIIKQFKSKSLQISNAIPVAKAVPVRI